jgi:multimeric flavodoxin WrbA
VFDCAAHKVGPCRGCYACHYNGPCVQKDDFGIVRPHILEADIIVFATPVYYFGPTAQIKTVVDRFLSIAANDKLKNKKSVLLTTQGNPDVKIAEPTVAWYKAVANYNGWEDAGMVLATGVLDLGSVKNTHFGQDAYELGKSL